MENVSFCLSTHLGYALDEATSTNQDNLDLDLFVSDTASADTNMTYDAGTDRYDCDTGGGTDVCTLTTAVATVTVTDTMAIVKTISTSAATTALTIEVSFDNGGNYTSATEKVLTNIPNAGTQMKIKFTFTRSNTASTDYIEGYGAYFG